MLSEIPPFISHYYEESRGPLKSVSELDRESAREIIKQITEQKEGFNSNRSSDYIDWRINVENWLREGFIKKGGKPKRKHPHYFILGACEWMLTWYKNGQVLKKDLKDIDSGQMSFTYPDSMVSYQLHQYHISKNNPYFKEEEHREYHGQVYSYSELNEVVSKYGIPKGTLLNNNPISPFEMYIEVQVWDQI
jgi:hypothetical protein